MFGVAWMTCVGGSRLTIFGRMLGFSDFDFGVLAAIPFLARFGQLIATILIERTGLRKYQFIDCALIHRMLWLAMAAIPLMLPIPSRWGVRMMLVMLGVSWFAMALATPAWVTWMGDLIPSDQSRTLITSGVYSRTRNPMLFGYLLCLCGLGLLEGSLSSAFLLPLIYLGVWLAWIKLREEPALERRFGEGYSRYREEIPFLIPRLCG